jgi:hypothetical protein
MFEWKRRALGRPQPLKHSFVPLGRRPNVYLGRRCRHRRLTYLTPEPVVEAAIARTSWSVSA